MGKKQTEKKYNFVYQTKNLINGKTYIGVRCTNNLNDGYIGCGVYSQESAMKGVERDIKEGYKGRFKQAVVKYGYNNFKREILSFFDTAEEAYEEEAWLVDEEWVRREDTYNVSLGGIGGHMGYGRLNHKYRGDIYIFNKETKEFIGVYESATQIKLNLGHNQARISKCLKGESSGHKEFFYTRNPDKWEEELNNWKIKVRDKLRYNTGIRKQIFCYTKEGVLYKVFPSKAEACRHFNKSKNGVCYLDDVIDKFRKTDGKPLSAWGFVWKSKEVNNEF